MKINFKIFIIFTFLLSFLSASNIEDAAFKAYKSGEYKNSIMLYTKGAKLGSRKSLLMLALFNEKGIGQKKNRAMAIKLYKLLLKRSSNVRQVIVNRDFKKANITIAALERLAELSQNSKYLHLSNRLKKLIVMVKSSEDNLFNNESSPDDFLILCPNASIIPKEDREGIEEFDCALFENFPKKMKLFMHLRRLRAEVIKLPLSKGAKMYVKLDSKIKKLIVPMLEQLKQDTVNCYTLAKEKNDIRSCDYDYLLKSDPLLFDNAAYDMEHYILNNKLENHELSSVERERLINELISKITSNKYMKKWRAKK